jgi:hypothetical protein
MSDYTDTLGHAVELTHTLIARDAEITRLRSLLVEARDALRVAQDWAEDEYPPTHEATTHIPPVLARIESEVGHG